MITTIPTPRINTNDDKVEVVFWHVEAGALVESGQDIVDVETSKAVVTLSAEASGYVRPLVAKGVVVRVGDPLYILASSADELTGTVPLMAAPPVAASELVQPSSGSAGGYSETRFSQAALKILRDRGLSASDFKGAGLVTARTLSGRVGGALISPPVSIPANSVGGAVFPPGPPTPRGERVSLAKQAEIQSLRRGESGNVNSKLSVYFDSAPIRARLMQEHSFDGNIQPLILFELSRLLRKWPQFTAYYEDGAVHYYDRVDIGLAFDLGKGLKVVTIKDADRLMPIEFFEKTIEIGLRYLENRIRVEELVGSTITVTDLSSFNVLHFHPLINGEQSAIIGLGGDGGQPGYPMSINMTFDHRVSNGREVALFLGELRERLLSYALTSEIAGNSSMADELLPPEEFAGSVEGVERACDTCGIGIHAYHGNFGRGAYLLAYFREDGTLGSVCHRCYGGWL